MMKGRGTADRSVLKGGTKCSEKVSFTSFHLLVSRTTNHKKIAITPTREMRRGRRQSGQIKSDLNPFFHNSFIIH